MSTSKIDDGGPAFPVVRIFQDDDKGGSYQVFSMSRRDYFAGQALAGILAAPEQPSSMGAVASTAWEAADAMIAARRGGAA